MFGYSKISDNELISFLKKGDERAYTEIYNRYFELMFLFAFKKLEDEDLAKDFVQELFLNLWNKREGILEEGKLSSYLYIYLRSRLFDYFAHQKVENKYIEFLKTYQISTYESTDHLIREQELIKYIEKQIQALPKKMRRIFELSRKEHLSHKEIADKLNISENNVSSQIHGALKIFKAKLKSI